MKITTIASNSIIILVIAVNFSVVTENKNIYAQENTAVELLTEDDSKFLEKNGMKLSDLSDQDIIEIKQPSPSAHEQRIKSCMDMKDAIFISNDVECVSWMLTLEGNYKLIQWAIKTSD